LKAHAAWLHFLTTIHHGIPLALHEANYRAKGGYVAFVGRISPEKGADDAIRIATSLGIPLKIAAEGDKVDEPYFREVVEPMLSAEGVEFIGEISEKEKGPFLRDALALLFPIRWPEPFGLVMIEAMSCGTPVLGYRAGAAPEVIDEGVTGMIVDNIAQAGVAMVQVAALDRRKVRRRFEERLHCAPHRKRLRAGLRGVGLSRQAARTRRQTFRQWGRTPCQRRRICQ
jgi:glycosyltransferase involved in cell wall biosynthesis